MSMFFSMTHGETNRKIIISPFVDLSYDLGKEEYRTWIGTDYYTHNGTNLSLGINFYREPLLLQFQIANLYDHFNKGQNIFGTGKIEIVNKS